MSYKLEPCARRLLLTQIQEHLIADKGFTATGAATCAESFVATMECADIPVEPKAIHQITREKGVSHV